jgi:hypothetical protein
VKRLVAKLAQNAFYGKLGQQEVQDSHKVFFESEAAECLKLLSTPQNNIKQVELMANGQMCYVCFEPLVGYTRGHFRKSDVLAAHVTAYARRYLNRIERLLGYHLVYVDTDSASHTEEPQQSYSHGYRVGDMEPDMRDVDEWIACGRKFYMYRQGDVETCKLKGVTLKKKHEERFKVQRLKELMWKMQESTPTTRLRSSIEVEQRLFVTECDKESGMPVKRTKELMKATHIDLSKRVILWPGAIDTSYPFASTPDRILSVPYGFLNDQTFVTE